MTSHLACDLLVPWIDYPLGETSPDPRAQLAVVRSMLPGQLPDDYVAVLLAIKQPVALRNNAISSIEPPCPRIPGQFTHVAEGPEFAILYGLGGGQSTSRTIPKMLAMMKDQMPKGLVPIGDSYGDQICIDVSEAGNGRVFYWWHEGDPGEDDAEGYPGWGNTFLLAHSFTDLCARIAPPPPSDPDEDLSGARICWTRP